MPVMPCTQKNGKPGWKCGQGGACVSSKAIAEAMCRAYYAKEQAKKHKAKK